jgi:hypothetical protein
VLFENILLNIPKLPCIFWKIILYQMLCSEREESIDCQTEGDQKKADSEEFLLNNSIDHQATVGIDNVEESKHNI